MRTANNMMFLSMYRNQLTRRSIDDWQFGGCIMSKHDKCAFMKIQCLSIFLASKHHVHTVCVHYLIYLHFLNLWQWKVVFKAVKVIAYMATDTSHPTHMLFGKQLNLLEHNIYLYQMVDFENPRTHLHFKI